jgi:hypothetical protein
LRFELSGLRQLPEAQSRRQILRVARPVVILFSIFGLVVIGYGYYSHHGFVDWIPSLVLLVGVCAMMIVSGTMFILAARTVALFLDADSRGFCFDFGDSRPWKGSWDDPRLRLQVVRFDPIGDRPPTILAAGGSMRRAYLTEEAFDELIRLAKASGLRTTEARPARNPSALVITISR